MNNEMNEPVFENSMFTNDKSSEISIRAWVGIQNATTAWLQTGALADCNVYRLIDIGFTN